MDEKAKVTWEEAEIIRRIEVCSNSAANRYYFAVLQAMFGFAERNGHHLPRSQGGNHKWATETMGSYLQAHKGGMRTFQRLKRLRVKADYEPAPVIMEDLGEDFISEVGRIFSLFSSRG